MKIKLYVIIAAINLIARSHTNAELILTYIEESFPPPEIRIEQIRGEFKSLKRPLDFKQDIKGENNFRGVDSCEIKLYGDTLRFAQKYTNVEIIHALWPMLDDPKTDADTCIVLFGKFAPRMVSGYFSTYKSQLNPGDWEYERTENVDFCKMKSRQVLGHGNNPFWQPHPVLFEYDHEKFKTINIDQNKCAVWVEKFRKWLGDPDVVKNNPLEVDKIMTALFYMKKNAKDAAPEVAELLFYSWQQAGNYRYDLDFYDKWLPFMNMRDIPEDKIIRTVFPISRDCSVPYVLSQIAGTNAIPLVLSRYTRTTHEDRLEKPGGGYAPAFAIYYLNKVNLTRKEAVDVIESYAKNNSKLTPEQLNALESLRVAILNKEYEKQNVFINSRWFADDPPMTYDERRKSFED